MGCSSREESEKDNAESRKATATARWHAQETAAMKKKDNRNTTTTKDHPYSTDWPYTYRERGMR